MASSGVFQNYYETQLSESSSDISWIGGLQVFCLLVVSTLSGRATHAGLARPVVLAGSILILLGTFVISLASQYWQIFLAQGLCIGLGQGLIWLPSVTVISTYFARNRVFAVTAAATGTSTGGMVFPAMIQYLTPQIAKWTGFPWAVRCMGFLALIMAIIINLLLRTRLPPRRSGPLVEWAAFKEPSYMLFTFGIFLLLLDALFRFFLSLTHTDPSTAGVNLVIVINAAGIPIRAPGGYLADRYTGPLNRLIPWVAICGVLMYCWIGVHTVAGLYLFAGRFPSLTKDMSKIGTRVGMVLALMSVGPLTGPSVAGALISRTGGRYLAAQVWAGSAFACGCGGLGGRESVCSWLEVDV
ncbi:MFS general substrate transporter [Aspergillus ibericus CBS 121593]|uniref:MFS general substrate transporter n=1 Tax=Aspergillus ibericus CBS 121593 TaxID=1448316 RepID=A0A395GXS4_9EURO|nr:MFS general substrate transporter [Aspergillus ibericus CBS 121593]RAL00357.1 MFS general substrate transporter [Aspergillus ibericus CBS 121593]